MMPAEPTGTEGTSRTSSNKPWLPRWVSRQNPSPPGRLTAGATADGRSEVDYAGFD